MARRSSNTCGSPVSHEDGGRITRGEDRQRRDIACEKVVNCAGQWARQVGVMAGINVPLQPVKHQYIITEKMDGLSPATPRPSATPTGARISRKKSAACHGRLRTKPAGLDHR
jgi:glycine/D-amino acid oxidase-like deaminating enzyme